MTPQPTEPTRDEARAQLALILDLLDEAEAHYEGLPGYLKAQVAAMPDERAHEQLVASLAVLPPETRAWIRLSLAQLVSQPEA